MDMKHIPTHITHLQVPIPIQIKIKI